MRSFPRTVASFCHSFRTDWSRCGGAVSVMTSSGPLWPQESVMWNSQLPALLEKRRRKKEGRKRGRSALLCISVCGPSPPFPGATCRRRGGFAAPARPRAGSSLPKQQWRPGPGQTSRLSRVPAACGEGQSGACVSHSPAAPQSDPEGAGIPRVTPAFTPQPRPPQGRVRTRQLF